MVRTTLFGWTVSILLASGGQVTGQPERGTLTPGQKQLPMLSKEKEKETTKDKFGTPDKDYATQAAQAAQAEKDKDKQTVKVAVPDGYHEMNFDFASYDVRSRQLVVKGAAPTGWKVEIGQTIKGDVLTAHIFAKIPAKWSEEPTPFRLVLNLAASERVRVIDIVGRELAYKIEIAGRNGSLADE